MQQGKKHMGYRANYHNTHAIPNLSEKKYHNVATLCLFAPEGKTDFEKD